MIRTGIITISDRAARGVYPDLSGPALKEAASRYGWAVAAESLVPDERAAIQQAIRRLVAGGCQLILTTGGTGVSPRDITPEAVREIAQREVPGFGEAMRMGSLKSTPNALISRSLAVIVDGTLVVCLPGKPNAAGECLGLVAPAVPHCVQMLQPGAGH